MSRQQRWWSLARLGDSTIQTIGLVLNEDKCEIISDDISVVATVKAVMPNIRHIPRKEAVLLLLPVSDNESVYTIFSSKLTTFCLLASRLTTFNNNIIRLASSVG